MKKWYLFLVIFSFSAPLIGMEQDQPLEVIVQAQEGASDTSDQKRDTAIDIERLVERLEQRYQERKQAKNNRCYGMYPWLKHLPPTIQLIGSVSSTIGLIAGIVMVYYH